MKIIFDNEEQKEKFIFHIAKTSFCPDEVLIDKDLHCNDCKSCWENAVEMEVKE